MNSISTRKAYNMYISVLNDTHLTNHIRLIICEWLRVLENVHIHIYIFEWCDVHIRNIKWSWLRILTTNNRTSGSKFYFIFFISTIPSFQRFSKWWLKTCQFSHRIFLFTQASAFNIEISKIRNFFLIKMVFIVWIGIQLRKNNGVIHVFNEIEWCHGFDMFIL